MEAEIAAGLKEAQDEFERSLVKRNQSSRAKTLAGSLLLKFPEDVKLEEDTFAIVDRAERHRVGVVKKKFRVRCEEIWFGEKPVRS